MNQIFNLKWNVNNQSAINDINQLTRFYLIISNESSKFDTSQLVKIYGQIINTVTRLDTLLQTRIKGHVAFLEETVNFKSTLFRTSTNECGRQFQIISDSQIVHLIETTLCEALYYYYHIQTFFDFDDQNEKRMLCE